MKLYIKRKNNSINAVAEYNPVDKSITVLKGSIVSDSIAYGTTFRGANSIEKRRIECDVLDCVVNKDITFKSASTAANFVTGASTNGLIAWKNENGITLKELLNKENK